MTYQRRPMLRATVSARVAWLITRQTFVAQLEAYARKAARSPDPEMQQLARDLVGDVAEMREAARQFGERRDRGVAADGNAALPPGSGGPESSSPPWQGLSVVQVAERLGLQPRQVRNLCEVDGPLSATKQGGVWLIEASSVAALEAIRRSA